MVFSILAESCIRVTHQDVVYLDAEQEGQTVGECCTRSWSGSLDLVIGIALLTIGLLGVFHVIPLPMAASWAFVALGAVGIAILPLLSSLRCCSPVIQALRGCCKWNKLAKQNNREHLV